ncbi:hypothetical protein OIU84_027980 [Salix udensis]|uniref:PRA1 family protein n=1 Tax=Salix udensis TaxID=889485 RepID=A0AAD6KDX0_9ROSI|nr:hypothetical protein OIU84_027980 [Salix udensis]
MASHGTIQRPSTVAAPTTPTAGRPEDSTGKTLDDFRRPEFRLVCPPQHPVEPRSSFSPNHTKPSPLCIVLHPFCVDCSLHHPHPTTQGLSDTSGHHDIIDKRIVLGLIVMATMIELIATKAGLHLVITLAATVPLVLTHAVFWVRNDFCVEKRGGGNGGGEESVPLVDGSTEIV